MFQRKSSLFDKFSRAIVIAISLTSVLLATQAAEPAYARNYTVTTTADSGAGSLRQAMLDANATNAKDTIKFKINGAAPYMITLLSDLPILIKPIVIDGTTQTGYTTQPLVWVVGQSSTCFELGAGSDGSTIKGLSIGDMCDGPSITLIDSNEHTIQSNFLGTLDGVVPEPNFQTGYSSGIRVYNSDDNQIGGTDEGDGNLVSGNSFTGVMIEEGSDNNIVEGNMIGTDISGGADMGNLYSGLHIDQSTGNLIGGTDEGARNILSGNGSYGIEINGPGNTIQGNYIGTNITGANPLGNGLSGVAIGTDGGETVVGGTEPGAGNVLSANGYAGVSLDDFNSVVQGNLIGTDATGTLPLGNMTFGVAVSGSDNLIGGTVPGAGNVISGNYGQGVYVTGAFDAITGTYIYGTNNILEGNFIGTDETTTRDLGNQTDGIEVVHAVNTMIGGAAPGAGNWILHNDAAGVSMTATDAVLQSNRIRHNNIGIGVYASATFTLNTMNCISNNTVIGMDNPIAPTEIAEGNWWGGPNGPTHASNPGGKGETVSNNIDFDPWVTTSCSGLLDQRVINGGFEVDTDADRLPDDWTGSALTLGALDDGQDCTVAQAGACSFRFVGANKSKKITQSILVNGDTGEDITLSAYTREDNVPAAKNYRIKMTIYHIDGSKQTVTLNLPTGTNLVFAKQTATLITTTEPYDEILVEVEYTKKTGTVWLDAVSVLAVR